MVTALLFIYALGLAFVLVDSYVNSRKAGAGERIGAFLWSSTVGALLAFLVVAWWFVRAFIGAFLALGTDIDVQPTGSETNRAKQWVVFPQEQAAVALTGRGGFKWTP